MTAIGYRNLDLFASYSVWIKADVLIAVADFLRIKKIIGQLFRRKCKVESGQWRAKYCRTNQCDRYADEYLARFGHSLAPSHTVA